MTDLITERQKITSMTIQNLKYITHILCTPPEIFIIIDNFFTALKIGWKFSKIFTFSTTILSGQKVIENFDHFHTVSGRSVPKLKLKIDGKQWYKKKTNKEHKACRLVPLYSNIQTNHVSETNSGNFWNKQLFTYNYTKQYIYLLLMIEPTLRPVSNLQPTTYNFQHKYNNNENAYKKTYTNKSAPAAWDKIS